MDISATTSIFAAISTHVVFLALGLLLLAGCYLLLRWAVRGVKRLGAEVKKQKELGELYSELSALNDWMVDFVEDEIVSVEEALALIPTAVRNRGLHPNGARLVEKYAADLMVYEGSLITRAEMEEVEAYLDGGSPDDVKNRLNKVYLVKVLHDEQPEIVLSVAGQKAAELVAVALSNQYPEKDTFCHRDAADGSRHWAQFRYGRKVAN